MEFDVFFDESGDLGWVLDKPFRNGGSSKFFVISYIIIPTESKKHIVRFVKKTYKNRNKAIGELKGTNFKARGAKTVSREIILLLERHGFKVGCVVVKKCNVPIRLKDPQNKEVLYNFMVQLGICDKITSLDKVNIVPDARSVPNGSENSCSDLIKSKLWMELGSNTIINYSPEVSHQSYELMFIDWITNFTWRFYEDEKPEPLQILSQCIEIKTLFF